MVNSTNNFNGGNQPTLNLLLFHNHLHSIYETKVIPKQSYFDFALNITKRFKKNLHLLRRSNESNLRAHKNI